MIRHVCCGHEYRFNPDNGQVINNYGTVKAVLLNCVSASCQSSHVAKLYPAKPGGTADTRKACRAILRTSSKPSAAWVAQFAIGHTAVNFPECR